MKTIESASWSIKATIEKFAIQEEQYADVEASVLEAVGMKPYETIEVPGNLLTNTGAARLMDLLIGAGGQAYANGNCAIGVGTSATAATNADTDLNGAANASNRYWQTTDSTFPSRSGQTLTFKSTFTTGNANFAWAEWAISNATASGSGAVTAVLLNHKVTALGTKTSAASWAFSATLVVA